MIKKLTGLILIFLLVLPLTAVAGSLGKGDPDGTPGQWYLGSTPSYVAPHKSPIVFVHGLNSSATTWWVENDMYSLAYANGYETAFVDIYPTQNMWDNGELLAAKLEEIYNHFGEKLVVVAHSKGGIDTQTALVHYGAYPYVHRVITLSSPHQGSELADLAHSSWAGWLAGILGSKSDATYSLQTGYMANFRSQTDSHANVYKNPFYTLAGTAWGSFGSSLYWGGLYLRAYGPNDGAVTVQSSRLSYATEVAVGDWNHSEIREGSYTFNQFESLLYDNSAYSTAYTVQEEKSSPVEVFYRGGSYKQETTETFVVEEGVSEIIIDWMSEQKDTTLTLISPNGQRVSSFSAMEDTTSVFAGAYHHSTTVSHPSPGEWKIEARSPAENYLLSVYFNSDLNDDFEVLMNEKAELKVESKGKKVVKDKTKTMITVHYYKNDKAKTKKLALKKNEELSTLSIPKLGAGVYNITIDIQGMTTQGKAFNRTKILSIYIDENGNVFQ